MRSTIGNVGPLCPWPFGALRLSLLQLPTPPLNSSVGNVSTLRAPSGGGRPGRGPHPCDMTSHYQSWPAAPADSLRVPRAVRARHVLKKTRQHQMHDARQECGPLRGRVGRETVHDGCAGRKMVTSSAWTVTDPDCA